MRVHSVYHVRAAGMMGGDMIVMVKCGGEEAFGAVRTNVIFGDFVGFRFIFFGGNI